LHAVTVVVDDYDRAIEYYVGVLGFRLREDTVLSPSKRWVLVSPEPDGAVCLLLAAAATDEQRQAIGNQTGGRVGFFLHTDDFEADYLRLVAAGVRMTESPRDEPYGKVVVFADLYGNLWDLIGPY
jgi:catechol 2,3-dioxygenase-like lactoylglutathione lyase family enzyme